MPHSYNYRITAGGRHRNHPKAERTEQMKIEKNDMVMVYDGGGDCSPLQVYRQVGDLTAYWAGDCLGCGLSVPAGGERGVRLAGSPRPALVTVFTGRHSLRS